MANEITLTASLSGFKPSVMSAAVARSIVGYLSTMTGSAWIEGIVLLAVTPGTAFPLGTVTAPKYAVIRNLDSANFFTLRNGSGGTDLLKFAAGDWGFFPFLDTSVPWGIANTAAVNVEYLIFSL